MLPPARLAPSPGPGRHRHRQRSTDKAASCNPRCGGLTSIRAWLSDLDQKTKKTQTHTRTHKAQTTNPKPPKQRAVLTRPAHPSAPKTRSPKKARPVVLARMQGKGTSSSCFGSCKTELHAPGPAKGGAGLQGGSFAGRECRIGQVCTTSTCWDGKRWDRNFPCWCVNPEDYHRK